ncbi:MAG: universal stress protein, partial [Gammaproteobacteria bacterium]
MKDILVHMDNSKQCESRLRVALDLAMQHDAHLTGLYIMPPAQVAAYSVSYAEFPFSPDILDQQRQIARENADKAAALFQEKTT